MKKDYKGYKCFSVPQKDFLMSRGLEFITVAKDPKSLDTFWLFLRNNDLDQALTIWSNSKPKNN